MSVAFAQTGTATTPLSAGCSGGTLHSGAVARKLVAGGTGASTESSWTLDNGQTAVIAALITDAGAVDLHTWAAGPWTVLLNATAGNKNVDLEAIHICRLDSAGNVVATVGSATAIGTPLAAGVYTTEVAGTAQTHAAGDRVGIYITVRNTVANMTNAIGITFNQTVTTPITAPSLTQSAYRARNDDGDEASATWQAATDTAWTQPAGERFRVRCVVGSAAAGAGAFGWQWGGAKAEPTWSDTVPNTPTLAGIGWGAAFNPDGTFLAVAHSTSPFLTVIDTSNWTVVPNTPTLAGIGYGAAFNHDGTRLAVAHVTSPNLTVIDTSNWTVVPNTPTLAGTGYGAAFNHDGTRLAVAHGTSPNLTVVDDARWSAIAPTGPVHYATSPHLTDQGVTTQQVGTGTFTPGRIYASAHTATVTFAGGDETEMEAVVEMDAAQVDQDEQVQFRVVREA